MSDEQTNAQKRKLHIAWLERSLREFEAWSYGQEASPRSFQLREGFKSMLVDVKSHDRPDRTLVIQLAGWFLAGIAANPALSDHLADESDIAPMASLTVRLARAVIAEADK